MHERGAFPGWLSRLWWVLLPGVMFAAIWALGFLTYLVSAWTGDRATGLAAVAGGDSLALVVFFVSWVLASLALMHLWMLVAAGFAVQRRAQIQRQEKWKLLGTGLALLAVYSPLLAAVVVRIFTAG